MVKLIEYRNKLTEDDPVLLILGSRAQRCMLPPIFLSTEQFITPLSFQAHATAI